MIIRNEENFAEKTSFGFSYAKVILVSVLFFTFMLVISLLLVSSLLAKWFDPRHAQMEQNKMLKTLALKVDSLYLEMERKDNFIANFQQVLSGDTLSLSPSEILLSEEMKRVENPTLSLDPRDSAFRQAFEQSDLALIPLNNARYSDLQEIFFFPPLVGFISLKYDVKKGHFGTDIVAKTNEPVKCIADGIVIFSSWTQDSGNVIIIQHTANLISVYKHNAELYKKVGTFVNAGEIISIVGNSGELTNGPHLHFELWYNGNSLDPEQFVTF